MGLRNDILSDLSEAFDTDLADAVQPFTLYKGETYYDPNTGNIILGETQSFIWRGVFSKAKKLTVEDGGELPVEIQVVCLANEADFPPDTNDHIITNVTTEAYNSDNNCYRIYRIDIDPSFSVYTLYIRSATHGPLQSRIFSGSNENN